MQESQEDKQSFNNTNRTITDAQSERDELMNVESEHEPVMQRQHIVDNNHSLADVKTQQQLDRTSSALAKEKTKRRSRPGLVLLACLLMAVAGAIAALAIYKAFFEPTNKPQATTAQPVSVPANPASSVTATKLVDTAKGSLKGTLVKTTIDSNGLAVADNNMGAYTVPMYRPDGYEFYTTPQTYTGVTAASATEETAAADLSSIRAVLASNKLQAIPNFSDEATIKSQANYIGASVVCADALTTEAMSAGKFQAQLGCADVASYTETAKAAKPLYDVLKSAKPDVTTTGFFMQRTQITPSKTADYTLAATTTGSIYSPVGSSVAHFYKTPDGVWHYFANSQNEMLCSEYNTTDLKKAYFGQTCGMTNGKQATVTL